MNIKEVCLVEAEDQLEKKIFGSFGLDYVQDRDKNYLYVIDLERKDEILTKIRNIKKCYEENEIC